MIARIKHKDIFSKDIEWQSAGEGAKYAQFLLDPDDAEATPSVILARFEPNQLVPPHTHDCNYLEYIVEGSQLVGKINFEAGDIRWASARTGYGPIRVGPEGCTVIVVFEHSAKSAPILLGKAREQTGAITQ